MTSLRSLHVQLLLVAATFLTFHGVKARLLLRNNWDDNDKAREEERTCESLKCCNSNQDDDDDDNKPPVLEPVGKFHTTNLPPPVPDGGPYPIRQKAVLPGLDDEHNGSSMKHEYYSGFLNAGVPPSGRGTMYLHYICAMAKSGSDEEHHWADQPMILWYNGGPGAPSTFGLFQEFGPYLLTSESLQTETYHKTGIPTPIYNPWTWANHATICEIDSPAPMGASFCTEGNGTDTSRGGPSGDPYSCGPWTDHSVAAANHQAYQSFFRHAFPEFERSQQPVSIVGESYAGVYVPLFVEKWLEDPITGPNGIPIKFAGFAVGDGFPACINPSPDDEDNNNRKTVNWCADLNNVGFFRYPNALPGPFWDVEFFHGHSQMSEALYKEIMSTCTTEELKGIVMPLSNQCQNVIDMMTDEVGLFHVYNLLEACPTGTKQDNTAGEPNNNVVVAHPRRMFSGNAHKRMSSHHRRYHRRHLEVPPNNAEAAYPPSSPGDGDTGLGAPCLGNSMDVYFDLDVVKQGLGIPFDNNFIVLDNGIGFNYTTTASFVGPIYHKAIDAGLRVLVYEGDTDACGLQTAPIESVWVPYFGDGDGEWTPMGKLQGEAKPLGLPMTTPWRPFSVLPGPESGVQGGYVIEWKDGQVSFVSIRGAGHLAPLYRPAASYTMMEAFLKQISLPGRPTKR